MGPRYHKLPAVKIDKEKLVFPVKLVAKPVSGDGASFHWDIPLNAWVVEVVREPEYGHYEITGYMALKGNRLVVAEIGDGHEGLDVDSLVTVPLERIERKKRKYLQTALGRSHYGIPFHMSVTGNWRDDANPNHDGGYEILKDQDARVYPRVKIVNKEVGEISDPGETTWEVLSIPTHTLGTIATDLLAWAEERALDPSEYLYRVGKKAKGNPRYKSPPHPPGMAEQAVRSAGFHSIKYKGKKNTKEGQIQVFTGEDYAKGDLHLIGVGRPYGDTVSVWVLSSKAKPTKGPKQLKLFKNPQDSRQGLIAAAREVCAQNDHLNCRLFTQLVTGTAKLESLPKVKHAHIGDVLQFGSSPARHWALYLGKNEVVEVPEWGEPARIRSVAALVEEWDKPTYIRRTSLKAKRNPARLYSNKPGVLTAFHEQLSGGVHKGVRPSMVVPDSPLLLEGEPYWRGRLWADTDRRSADTGFVYILRLRSGVFAFTGQITNVGRNVPVGIGRSWWLITLAQLKDYQPDGRGVLPDAKRAIGTLHLPLRNHSGTSTRRVVRKGLISVANEAIRWAEEMVMPPDEYLYWGGRSRPLQNPKKNPQRGGAGILFIHGKKMLLMRRSSQVKNPGQWGIPGGGAERGESSLQTAIRETEEEAGRQAAAYVAHGKKGLSGTVRYFHGPLLFGAAFTTFLCLVPKEFKPKLNWEHDDWKWVTRQQADRMNLHKGVRKMLKEGI